MNNNICSYAMKNVYEIITTIIVIVVIFNDQNYITSTNFYVYKKSRHMNKKYNSIYLLIIFLYDF